MTSPSLPRDPIGSVHANAPGTEAKLLEIGAPDDRDATASRRLTLGAIADETDMARATIYGFFSTVSVTAFCLHSQADAALPGGSPHRRRAMLLRLRLHARPKTMPVLHETWIEYQFRN